MLLHQSSEAVNKEKGRFLGVTVQGYVSVKKKILIKLKKPAILFSHTKQASPITQRGIMGSFCNGFWVSRS